MSSKDQQDLSKEKKDDTTTSTAVGTTNTSDKSRTSIPSNNSSSTSKTSGRTNKFDKVLIKSNGVCYITEGTIGNGSFGVVTLAKVADSNECVAIKKVLQDQRYKNRELQIMKLLNHINIVQLKNSFYTTDNDEVFLNLVLEYVPDTVYRISRHYSMQKQPVPLLYVKLCIYQLCRSINYIHTLGICHRDIKPQNLLLDTPSGILKLCDFGSAKLLVKGETNVSYICSRHYRAPELIFGSTNYTTTIDIWSLGCVLAELLLGQPLFPGENGIDQLVEIIKVLGTPTKEQIHAMNPYYTSFKFPEIKPNPWSKVFRSREVPAEAIDLLSGILRYDPTERLKPIEICAHPFFNDLRNPETKMPDGKALPPLFNFTLAEQATIPPKLANILIPQHALQTIELPSPLFPYLTNPNSSAQPTVSIPNQQSNQSSNSLNQPTPSPPTTSSSSSSTPTSAGVVSTSSPSVQKTTTTTTNTNNSNTTN